MKSRSHPRVKSIPPLRFCRSLVLCAVCASALLIAQLKSRSAETEPLNAAKSSANISGWQSLGAAPPPVWDGKSLLFHNEQGILAITPLSDEVIRVRFTSQQSFGRDHSYAVVSHGSNTAARVNIGSDSTTLRTSSLAMSIRHNPLRIAFANAAGENIDADDA